MTKPTLRALATEILPTPPIWMMRQAGHSSPEYRATRTQAGNFLSLCHTPELTAKVTLQPIRRFGFDGAIPFADSLPLPQALKADLRLKTGAGPRLSTVTILADLRAPKPREAIHDTLAPVCETIRILTHELPPTTTLIGLTGASWTGAPYRLAGHGTRDQAAAHALETADKATFSALPPLFTKAAIDGLSHQVQAGAEVVKLFESRAGSLQGADFIVVAVKPCQRIIAALKVRHPGLPIIAFPRGAGQGYAGFAIATGANCKAIDQPVLPDCAAAQAQVSGCVQGNLAPDHLVTGGQALIGATTRGVNAFRHGPHICYLGHGITPDADPENVALMIATVRSA